MEEIDERPQEPLADHLREVSDGIAKLVREHVELAKFEFRDRARKAAFDSVLSGAGVGALALAWILLMFSASYGLAILIGAPLAFLIVGAVHLFIGFALVGVFGLRLMRQDRPRLPQVQEELGRDRQLLHRTNGVVRPRRPVPA